MQRTIEMVFQELDEQRMQKLCAVCLAYWGMYSVRSADHITFKVMACVPAVQASHHFPLIISMQGELLMFRICLWSCKRHVQKAIDSSTAQVCNALWVTCMGSLHCNSSLQLTASSLTFQALMSSLASLFGWSLVVTNMSLLFCVIQKTSGSSKLKALWVSVVKLYLPSAEMCSHFVE